ncbi:MAG: VOC family protein [Gammaproteobacteria bacterium]|nr:VOC family protein [Gammaproteobacteria bacterium]
MKVHDEQFQSANPILPVKDVKETARFYEEKLGFIIDIIWENPNYACVSRGGVVLEFGEGRPEHVGSGVCYIHVKNAEKIYQRYKEQGLNIVGDLEDREYGSKDFRIRDNNGNLLIFGSPLYNKKELIAERNVA